MMNKGQILQMLTTCTNTLCILIHTLPLRCDRKIESLRCSILGVRTRLLGFKHALTVRSPLLVFLLIVISLLIFTESCGRCLAVVKCCNSTYTGWKSSSISSPRFCAQSQDDWEGALCFKSAKRDKEDVWGHPLSCVLYFGITISKAIGPILERKSSSSCTTYTSKFLTWEKPHQKLSTFPPWVP